MDPATRLFELQGQPLSGVAFVRDYVELHFDGAILRALTPPSVQGEGLTLTFPESGSRDALCRLIGLHVLDVVARDRAEIVLHFEGAWSFAVLLSEATRSGPEAAHFVPGIGQPIEVW